MIARCSECNADIVRYWCNTYGDPCPGCGSTIFWVTHLGIPGHPAHEILMDTKTKEVFTDDMCDIQVTNGEITRRAAP